MHVWPCAPYTLLHYASQDVKNDCRRFKCRSSEMVAVIKWNRAVLCLAEDKDVEKCCFCYSICQKLKTSPAATEQPACIVFTDLVW